MSIHDLYLDRISGRHTTAIDEHLAYMHDLVLAMEAQQVIEIGVNTGGSTTAFLAALEQTGGALWSCDRKAPKHPIGERLDHPRWTFVEAKDTDALDAAPEACDILLLDASKDTESVLWQLDNYGARVRPGGAILVHDTDLGHVVEAIDAYSKAHSLEVREREGRHGMAVMVVEI